MDTTLAENFGLDLVVTTPVGIWTFDNSILNAFFNNICLHRVITTFKDPEKLVNINELMVDFCDPSRLYPNKDALPSHLQDESVMRTYIIEEILQGNYWMELHDTKDYEELNITRAETQARYELIKDKIVDKFYDTGKLENIPMDRRPCLHLGRLNMIFPTYNCSKCAENFIKSFKKDGALERVCKVNKKELKKDVCSEQWDNQTKEAIENHEYWFEWLPLSENSPLVSLNLSLTPHERYLLVKDQLDENYVWKP